MPHFRFAKSRSLANVAGRLTHMDVARADGRRIIFIYLVEALVEEYEQGLGERLGLAQRLLAVAACPLKGRPSN